MERERITGRMYSTEHHGRGWELGLLLILCLPAVYEADILVSPGDTVTLPCDGGTDKETNEVEVLWTFVNRPVCRFQNGTLCEHADFINRTQLGSIRQNNFSLVINDVRLEDQGEYKCFISDTVMRRNRLFVRGGWTRRAAETPPEENLVCKPYEDKDKEVPDENPPGIPSSGPSIDRTAILAAVFTIVMVITERLPIRENQL